MPAQALDHDALDRLRQTHPAWRMLAADHAPLLLGFFESAFIRPNRRAIPALELISQLDAHLSQLSETHGPERYPKGARQYLDDWAAPERGFLRKYYPRNGDDAEFDLTPSAERALEWIQSLLPHQFIGTESRLLTLLHMLRDLAIGAHADPAARVEQLERQRAELQHEIERVKSGRTGPMDETQIRERYFEITDTARRLLSDFRQVEENFRRLDAQTRERIALSTQSKGALLDDIFGATDHIRQSDQGKSFDAFWEFLMSPLRQDEMQTWLRAVHELPPVTALAADEFVRRVPHLLLDAGEKVHGTVAQLVEQLRRYVDDQAQLENRRILDLIRNIEGHAVALKTALPRDAVLAAIDEAAPQFTLPLCRALFRPPRNPVLNGGAVATGEAVLDLSALFAQATVDEQALRAHISELLRGRTQVTLAEVAAAFPPEHGLSEIVAYLKIAAADKAAIVDESVTELVDLPAQADKPARRVRLPRVIFAS